METHLAKLFKQKVEIFTKVEYTQVLCDYYIGDLNLNNSLGAMISFPYKSQESVVTTIVKLGLKSLQEFVRLQTFNRSGFQQIQLDIQFLRIPLRLSLIHI